VRLSLIVSSLSISDILCIILALSDAINGALEEESSKKRSSLQEAVARARGKLEPGGEGENEVNGSEKKKPNKKKKRLRNRNKFIDTFLKYEGGGDDFADLEDFIVTRDGQDYEALRYVVK